MTRQILVFEKFSELVIQKLQRASFDPISSDNLRQISPEAVFGIFLKVSTKLDSKTLDLYPNLKAIVIPATGTDLIDLRHVNEKKIDLISLRNHRETIGNFSSTTEIFLWLMISLLRNTLAGANDVIEGNWNRDAHIGTNIKGKKLGILGYGRIGRQIGSIAATMGMQVYFFDKNEFQESDNDSIKLNSAEELFEVSDVISINVDSDESNRSLVNSTILSKRAGRGLYLINTSRGFIVDEFAIIDALSTGNLLGYAADVLVGEGELTSWLTSNPLWKVNQKSQYNIVITPHLGGATRENIEISEQVVLETFLRKYKSR